MGIQTVRNDNRIRKVDSECLAKAQEAVQKKAEEAAEAEKKKHKAKKPLQPNQALTEGRSLPQLLQTRFPKRRLAGVPLLDIDPFYKNKEAC